MGAEKKGEIVQNYGIVHPHMLDRLQPNFYPSLCSFYQPGTDVNSAGEETQPLTAIPTLTNLACRIAAKSTSEAREPQQTYTAATHHIALNGYYAAITAALWLDVDGTLYSQEGQPEYDGNAKTTRVYARMVKP